MPRNTTVTVPEDAWTELTNADVTSCTVVNVRGDEVWVVAGSSLPTGNYAMVGSIPLRETEGLINATLADIWKGVASPVRLYAYCETGTVDVMISHA